LLPYRHAWGGGLSCPVSRHPARTDARQASSFRHGGSGISGLIVFPDEKTADNVWQELVELQQDYLVDLEDAAIIRRDSKGRAARDDARAPCRREGHAERAVLGALMGRVLLFPLAPIVGAAGGLMGLPSELPEISR
jgi:hypothetical protein